MIRVYAKVVADLMHPGHVEFFRQARLLGGHLTVCVVPDERVLAHKGRKPIMTTAERVSLVSACRWVDHVIATGPKVITLDFMNSNGFDLYAFGANDETELISKIQDCTELPASRRIQLPYQEGISTSQIILRIKQL